MNVLGINGFFAADHDAAAACLVDGKVIASVEEERLVRVKRAIGFRPFRSAAEVLSISNLDAGDIDVIAYPWHPSLLGANPSSVAREIVTQLRDNGIMVSKNTPVEFIKHHEAHAYAGLAYCPEELRESSDIVVLDGSGEVTSGAVYSFKKREVSAELILPANRSLGCFYEAGSLICGFSWGQEGKTMGLASYIPELLLSQQCIDTIGQLSHITDGTSETDERIMPDGMNYEQLLHWMTRKILTILGNQPHNFTEKAVVAAMIQAALERNILAITGSLQSKTLILSGGIALNCSTNRLLSQAYAKRSGNVIIPPCANDSGVALGAAVGVALSLGEHVPTVDTPSLGGQIAREQIFSVLSKADHKVIEGSNQEIADLITRGSLIGWVDGRAEIGPRALGNRSLIGLPSSERLRDRVNVLKGRETWRPLAPSMTLSQFNRSCDGTPSPYMLKAAIVNPSEKGLAGVTHVDGSARPQVIQQNKPYENLVKEVGTQSGGCEAILCTSFNRAGEPIVYGIEDALISAQAMHLDYLAGNNWICDLKR